jgi:hypothetical protein
LEAIYSLSLNSIVADRNKTLFSSEIKVKEKTENCLVWLNCAPKGQERQEHGPNTHLFSTSGIDAGMKLDFLVSRVATTQRIISSIHFKSP